jgi:hypothetical protein
MKYQKVVPILLGVLILAACGPTTNSSGLTSSTTTSTNPSSQLGTITWGGLADQTVVRGDIVDLLEGVTASDSIDGDITDAIVVKDDDLFSPHLAGGYTVTFEVTNSTGVVSTRTKNFTVLVGHNVANGDFSLGAFGWTLDNPGGASTIAHQNEKALITITNAGTSWWGIQLYQLNVVMKANTTYRGSLVASSSTPRSITLGLENPDNGFAMLNPGFSPLLLNSTEQTYEMYFTTTDALPNVKVVVYLGNQLEQDQVTGAAHVVTLDDIKFEEVVRDTSVTFEGLDPVELISGTTPPDVLSGVTATAGSTDLTDQIEVKGVLPTHVLVNSTYYVTYVIERSNGAIAYATRQFSYRLPKDFPYQAVNGSFEFGFLGWTQDVIQTQGTGQAEFTNNEDGTVNVKVIDPSDASWHIQLQQASSSFEAGEGYVARAVIKADAARKIVMEVVHPGSGFAPVGDAQALTMDVTTEYQTFEIPFTADKDYDNVKIGLLMGNVDGLQPSNVTFTVDELDFYKYDPFNEEMNDISPWVLDNITGTNAEGITTITFNGSNQGNDPWNNQFYQSSGSRLVAGRTYEVRVRIRTSIDRIVRAWVEDRAKGYAAIAGWEEKTEKNFLANTWDEIVYTMDITEALETRDAKFVVMLGDGISASTAHTVEIDYFQVTEVVPTVE